MMPTARLHWSSFIIDLDSYQTEPLPMFDVNFYDMNLSGTDTVAEGMLFRIDAEIVGFNSDGCYIILEPVSMTLR